MAVDAQKKKKLKKRLNKKFSLELNLSTDIWKDDQNNFVFSF